MENKQNNTISIPAAIIIAGAIIAFSIIWSQKPIAQSAKTADTQQKPQNTVTMAPITAQDHILGNPAAPIKIVEYSDTSCPFCKMFHPTMKSIIEKYGADGDVAWVYRHFPLDKPGTRSDGSILHPNAGYEAQALECASSLGGNDAFWKYTNRLYEITPAVTSQSPNGLDRSKLPEIATFAGLNLSSFNECLSSGRFANAVEQDYQDGLTVGVNGTPTSVIVLSKPAPIPLDTLTSNLATQYGTPVIISTDRLRILLSGALPEIAFTSIIDAILKENR